MILCMFFLERMLGIDRILCRSRFISSCCVHASISMQWALMWRAATTLIEDTNVNMVCAEHVEECISTANSGAANQSTSIVLLVVTAIFGNGTFGVRILPA